MANLQRFPSEHFKASVLHAQVEAALQGHDLAAFELVDERGWPDAAIVTVQFGWGCRACCTASSPIAAPTL